MSQLSEHLEYLLQHESYEEVRDCLRSSLAHVEQAMSRVRPARKEEPSTCAALADLPGCPNMGEMVEVKLEEGEGEAMCLLYGHVVDLEKKTRMMKLRCSHRGLADGRIVAVRGEKDEEEEREKEVSLSFSAPWREAVTDPWSGRTRWPRRGCFVALRGETLFWIAKTTKVSLESIYRLNQQLSSCSAHSSLPDLSIVWLDRADSMLEEEAVNGGLQRLLEAGIGRGEDGAIDVLLKYPEVESEASVCAISSFLCDAPASVR
eukprot:763334-Hanusia_phi.AAC.5